MGAIETLSTSRCFGGTQGFYQHVSSVIGLPMRYGVYRPEKAASAALPVVVFLAGLTCTEETFAIKSGAQRVASELGLIVVTPDTSPRDTGVPDADRSWDLGHGAGFYIDATRGPWAQYWKMESYLIDELIPFILHSENTTGDIGIFGHSMGGHGALSLGLRHASVFTSVSALAPICAPSSCPWGVKAFTSFLGEDRSAWRSHDATLLVADGKRAPTVFIDQGLDDQFLAEQLNLDLFEAACRKAGQPLVVRRHAGYDHGYYFISSFVSDHLHHHRRALTGGVHLREQSRC
jgi:S-formylglutathione hydrolase